jgi:ferritin-like metal-binding protein YciE
MKMTSKATSKVGRAKPQTQQQAASYTIEKPKLQKLFEQGLRDMYWVEKTLVAILPKMASKVSSEDLVIALGRHIEETKRHVQKLEQVFGLIGKKARATKCLAMEGLIKEGKTIIQETLRGAMRDAGVIAAAQKVEHYEIASYGTLRTYTDMLGMEHISAIFQGILDDEKIADAVLSDLASGINIQAVKEKLKED